MSRHASHRVDVSVSFPAAAVSVTKSCDCLLAGCIEVPVLHEPSQPKAGRFPDEVGIPSEALRDV